MNGEVNTQNVRQYAPKRHPPTFNFERSNSREHLTVWAAPCGNGMIFGPYFFERNVDGIAYLWMFNEFVFPQLADHFNNQHWERWFRGLWWAQDGAPAHRLIPVRDRLNDVFGNNCVIGLHTYKSANKPSTSCVRMACYKLSTSLEQVVNNLQQPCWYYQTCYKVVPTRLLQSWYNNIATTLCCQPCNILVISWLYQTC